VAVATPQVFAAPSRRDNASVRDLPAAALRSAPALASWLARATRNDLSPPAHQVAPVLSQVQTELAALPGCLLARISGSGGTHFGLFATAEAAALAARSLSASHPGWWVAEGPVLP
jgi:4-diphosphocytidyl-2-C-methyl-D-erythritol kinase